MKIYMTKENTDKIGVIHVAKKSEEKNNTVGKYRLRIKHAKK